MTVYTCTVNWTLPLQLSIFHVLDPLQDRDVLKCDLNDRKAVDKLYMVRISQQLCHVLMMQHPAESTVSKIQWLRSADDMRERQPKFSFL